MDHNAQLSKMDPKLKEAYERVMGFDHAAHVTNNTSKQPSTATSNSPTSSSVIPAIPPVQSIATTSSAQQPQDTASVPLEEIPRPAIPLRRSLETVHIQSQPILTTKTTKKEKTSAFIYYIGGVAFFIIYAVIWMKILNVPLPFLP